MKIVITGGHHSSALPVIKEIKNKHPEIEIHWFGHRHSLKGNKADTLEYVQINSLHIPFYDLKAGKFYKTYDIGRLLKIPFGFFQALFLLIKIRPVGILSFGGYLAVPTVLAGWVLGIPSVTHEQTVVVGYANKLIAKFAKKILVSWNESEKFFDKDKVVFTGLPLREEIFNSKSDSFNVNSNLPTIYITAGKSGSHKINSVVLECLEGLLQVANVIHQCGDHSAFNDFEDLNSKYLDIKEKVSGKYFSRKYVLDDEIGEAFSKATLVISRSGAHTVKELYALKKPCLLVPISWVSHNEQYKNAELLVDLGIGMIIEEERFNSHILQERVSQMINNISDYIVGEVEDNLEEKLDLPEKLIVKEFLNCLKQKI